jgi:hypothetical protein
MNFLSPLRKLYAILVAGVFQPWTVLVSACCIVSFVLQASYLPEAVFVESDEGDYLYAARMVAHGKVPYLDFVYLHPPGLLYTLAGGYAIFGELSLLRYSYLAINIIAGFLLYLLARRVLRSDWAGFLSSFFYLTFFRLFHHDGRFIAHRPFTSSIIILYLFVLLNCEQRRWRPYVLTLLFAYIAVLSYQAALIAGLFTAAWAAQRRLETSVTWRLWFRETFPVALALAIGASVSLAFLLAIPGAWEQTISEHLKFKSVPFEYRIWSLHHSNGYDFYPFVLGVAGLVIGIFTRNSARVYCAASLLSIATVLLPNEFFQHYYNLVVGPLMLGVGVFFLNFSAVLTRIDSAVASAGVTLLLIAQMQKVGPSLFKEWTSNRNEQHRHLVEVLKKKPEPFLTFINPIYAFEADKEMTPHPYVVTMRLLRMTGNRYSDDFYKQLISSACTILLTPADKKFLQPTGVLDWIGANPRVPLPNGIEVLLNQAPTCLTK